MKETNDTEKNIILSIIPGIVACIFIILVSIVLADYIGRLLIMMHVLPAGSASPISGIFVAILIGIIIRNTLGLAPIFQKGVAFSLKYALRAGIVLLGLRLSLVEAVKLGTWGLPLIVICISLGLVVTLYITKKMNESHRLGTLIACGTSICGVTAIMATSPVIKAKDNEISYAVANITIFGLIGMLCYPYVAYILFAGDPVKIGLFLGTAIHDTAQVTGAALMYDQMFSMEKVVDVATVTKLTRNLFIIAVIPVISYIFYKQSEKGASNKAGSYKIPKWYTFVPLFVIGFLLASLIRTIGDITVETGLAFSFIQSEVWESFYTNSSSFGSTYLLGIAMAGVGLSTDFKMFKGLGLKPFYIGFIAALFVGIVSFTLISLFGHFITI